MIAAFVHVSPSSESRPYAYAPPTNATIGINGITHPLAKQKA
jgi:hypothetical protein